VIAGGLEGVNSVIADNESQMALVREQAQLDAQDKARRVSQLQQQLNELSTAESGLRLVTGAALLSEARGSHQGNKYLPGQVRVATDGAIEYVTNMGLILRLGFGPIGSLRDSIMVSSDPRDAP